MVKKSLIAGLIAIILSLCCGLCFAAEQKNETSVNLGNEITQSIDKTGQSMRNLTEDTFSTNMIDDARNGIQNISRNMTNGINNMGASMTDGMNHVDDGIVNATETNEKDNAGNYNTTRTTTEATTATGFTAMSTTTWMWIILAVAAIIIIAAIWYYATQNNDR